ncbi:MAG: Rpn family recombination-promoting nuclease/putative transposase [Treponema sp.]|nr:Rpn family recombination-promoting nuclease/putative transposase [Treponema sp.]
MSNSYYFKPVEELTFADNGMFQAVLRDKEICKEFVERLLHIKIKNVEYPELEKSIAPFYTSKGVRLDVYLRDEEKVIDVEIQSYPQEALGKRTRYYQSMIDMDSLMKGQDYTELKDSYILFICQYDPFKKDEDKLGLPRYTFRTRCDENEDASLNDNCLKVIYNSTAYKEEKDPLVRGILQFINTNDPGQDSFANRLSTLVETLKERETFRQEYNAMNLHDRDLIRNAKKEGKSEAKLEDAVTAVKKYKISPEEAAQDFNVPLDKLLQELKAK